MRARGRIVLVWVAALCSITVAILVIPSLNRQASRRDALPSTVHESQSSREVINGDSVAGLRRESSVRSIGVRFTVANQCPLQIFPVRLSAGDLKSQDAHTDIHGVVHLTIGSGAVNLRIEAPGFELSEITVPEGPSVDLEARLRPLTALVYLRWQVGHAADATCTVLNVDDGEVCQPFTSSRAELVEGTSAVLFVSEAERAALLVTGIGTLWWSPSTFRLAKGGVVVQTIDLRTTCLTSVTLDSVPALQRSLLAEFRPPETAAWSRGAVLRAHLGLGKKHAFATPRLSGPWFGRAGVDRIPLRVLGSADNGIPLCKSHVRLELASEVVGVGLLSASGAADSATAFSIAMPGMPEPRPASPPNNLVYVPAESFDRVSHLEFVLEASRMVRVDKNAGRRDGNVIRYHLGDDHGLAALRVCSSTGATVEPSERPSIVLAMRPPWPPLALRHATTWSAPDCVQATGIGAGEYDVWWRWDRGGARLCVAGVALSPDSETRINSEIPAVRLVQARVDLWDSIPVDLRPSRIILDGVAAPIDQGVFTILTGVPPDREGVCELSFPMSGSASVGYQAWMDEPQGDLGIRFDLSDFEVHEVVVPPALGGRIRAEIWSDLPEVVGGSNPFGRLTTASALGELHVIAERDRGYRLVVWETAEGRSNFRGLLLLEGRIGVPRRELMFGKPIAISTLQGIFPSAYEEVLGVVPPSGTAPSGLRVHLGRLADVESLWLADAVTHLEFRSGTSFIVVPRPPP